MLKTLKMIYDAEVLVCNIHTAIINILVIGHSILLVLFEILQVNKANEIFDMMYNTDVCAILQY